MSTLSVINLNVSEVYHAPKKFEECHLEKLPVDILKYLFDILPTPHLVAFTATCQQFRKNEIFLNIVCKRIGITQSNDLQAIQNWKILSDCLKKKLPKDPFPLNFAGKNLLEIPKKIITHSQIEMINDNVHKRTKERVDEYFFNAFLTEDGMIVSSNLFNSIPAIIRFAKTEKSGSHANRNIYRMSIVLLTDPMSSSLFERGKRILSTTVDLFNSIFANGPLLPHPRCPRKYYRFLCNAGRPYAIFKHENYYHAVRRKAIKNKFQNESKRKESEKCSLQ